jgi:phosphate transport system permease protein
LTLDLEQDKIAVVDETGKLLDYATVYSTAPQSDIEGSKKILKGLRTMTANIVIEMGYAADLHREALIATGVVLFVFILLINLLMSVIKRRTAK